MNLPERVFDYIFVMVCECLTRLSFEEAAQQVNDNLSFFWIVSCPLPLHVECFVPIMVGVGDSQTMIVAYLVFILFNVALCAYVIGCVCACVIE